MAFSRQCKCYTTFGFGLTFLSIGLLLLIGWPYLYSYILQSVSFLLNPFEELFSKRNFWQITIHK